MGHPEGDGDAASEAAAPCIANACGAIVAERAIALLVACVDVDAGAALARALHEEVARNGANVRVDTTACAQLASHCRDRSPDVLLLEHTGSFGELGAVVQWARQAGGGTRVLVLRSATTDAQRLELIRMGVHGAVLAADPVAMIAKAVRSVHAGVPWFSRVMLYEAIVRQGCIPVQVADAEKLTRREHEVLDLIGAGLSNKEIARRLGISDGTVKTHLHRVYVKLHQSGRYKAFMRNAAADAGIDGAPWPTQAAAASASLRVRGRRADPLT
jgi:DNA-binding NarL/FixJ family response regulator